MASKMSCHSWASISPRRASRSSRMTAARTVSVMGGSVFCRQPYRNLIRLRMWPPLVVTSRSRVLSVSKTWGRYWARSPTFTCGKALAITALFSRSCPCSNGSPVRVTTGIMASSLGAMPKRLARRGSSSEKISASGMVYTMWQLSRLSCSPRSINKYSDWLRPSARLTGSMRSRLSAMTTSPCLP